MKIKAFIQISFAIITTSIIGWTSAFAAVSPVSISIFDPIQFPASDYTITGLRLSALYGQQQEIYGIDLGLIGNSTTQRFAGLAVSGVFNHTSGQTTALGAQLAGVANYNTSKTNVYGVQAALGLNYNEAQSSVNGLQLAAANIAAHTTVNGIQLGIYNRAKLVRGLQIGLINVTDNLTGFQIGLLNFHHRGVFKVSPAINFGF